MRRFDSALGAFACVLLAGLLACVLLGIVSRGLNDPLSWTDEGARFLMVWLAATGWMLAARRRGHVRIRFFQSLLPAPARRAAELLIQLAVAGFGAVVAAYGVALVGRNADLEATSLPLAMAWLYAPLIPAGVVTAVQALADARRAPA